MKAKVFDTDSGVPGSGLAGGQPGNVVRPEVQGIVLAGVHSWGENVLDRTVCRPLVPIAARPLICHTLDWLRSGGVAAASICANSDTIFLRRRLGDGEGLKIDLDYYEDVMPRGPAGCARDVSVNSDSTVFLVVEGTILPKIDLGNLLDAHRNSGAILTVVVTPARGAVVGIDGTGDAGPKRMLEPAGIYVFSRSVFRYVPETGYQDIKETLIPQLHESGERVESYVVDRSGTAGVNGLASYLSVSERAVERSLRQNPPGAGYVRFGDGLVHLSARLDPTVRLMGPVLVERGCTLEAGVIIVGPATVGEGCTIGRDSVISRSVMWSHCVVGARVILDHSILADRANVDSRSTVRHSVLVPVRPARRSLLERLSACWRSMLPPMPSTAKSHRWNHDIGKESPSLSPVSGRFNAPERAAAGLLTTPVRVAPKPRGPAVREVER